MSILPNRPPITLPETKHPKQFGLTNDQVHRSRKVYGSNSLSKKKREGFFTKLLQNFGDPMIRILLIALCINILFTLRGSGMMESIGIGIAILLATMVSTLSEYGNEKTFEKLQEDAARIRCHVYRAGELTELPIDEIVVGDLILLQAGDRIPADGALISGELEVDQAALNGESTEAQKIGDKALKDQAHCTDLLNINCVFRGSVVCSGEGQMQVTAVGDKTFYGNIAGQVQEETRESPLKVRLAHLAGTISKFGYMAAIAVSLAYLFHAIMINQNYSFSNILSYFAKPEIFIKDLFQALILAVVVMVMAVPEGLPMMITVVLSSNMRRMLKDHVLVRKLVGIETSGSLNILFADKTGTLTQGKLKVVSFICGNNRTYSNVQGLYNHRKLWDVLALSITANTDAVMSGHGKNRTAIGGNATDRAALQYIDAYPIDHSMMDIVSKTHFTSQNKYSSATIHSGSRSITLIKGAPEKILPFCKEYYSENGAKLPWIYRNEMLVTMKRLSGNAVRLLAVAISETPISPNRVFDSLALVGILCIQDPIRPEAKAGVSKVMKAGIQIVMITGDSLDTAMAVAHEVGLVKGKNDLAMTSDELSKLDDKQLEAILPQLRVVCRALPADKSRLVKVSQNKGWVVGMTGDGINDAPALKKADVGFSMGSGTEVAKEAGDIIILDDNIHSIAKAILYGRTTFKSIRKFIIFQITVNLCAVTVSIIGPFIGIEKPITVMQMLWINLVIDTLAGLAFGGEPPLNRYMEEPPKHREIPIINRYMWGQILITGFYTAILCLFFLKVPLLHKFFRVSPDDRYLQTAFFTLFLFCGIFNSMNTRTQKTNLLEYISLNKAFIVIMSMIAVLQIAFIYVGGTLFRTTPLTFMELLVTISLAATVIPVDILRKFLFSKFNKKKERL